MNNGGIRVDLRAGPLSWGDIYELQPFANRLMAMSVTGASLRHHLEGLVAGSTPRSHISGAVVEYDPAAPPRERIRRVRFSDGTLLDDGKRYRVVLSDFLASGGEGVSLTTDVPVEDVGVTDLDAMLNYLRAMPASRLVQTDALRAPRIRTVGPVRPVR